MAAKYLYNLYDEGELGKYKKNVWDMIENTPIAYNSEKVIEQLEERLCSETDAVMDVSCAMRNNHFKEAIEIVKAGGISDNH